MLGIRRNFTTKIGIILEQSEKNACFFGGNITFYTTLPTCSTNQKGRDADTQDTRDSAYIKQCIDTLEYVSIESVCMANNTSTNRKGKGKVGLYGGFINDVVFVSDSKII